MKNKKLLRQYLECVFVAFLYAFGFNLFIFPHNLFSSGFFGISQLLHYLFSGVFGMNLPVQTVSIIYLIMNIPIFFLMIKTMRKSYFIKTILVVVLQSVFMFLIPIPKNLVVTDRLTGVIAGAIVTGMSLGLTLRAAATSGGVDSIGVFITKKIPVLTVGKINIIVNLIIYTISGLIFGVETMIYSMIYTIICSFLIDRFHYQNISINTLIISKKDEIPKILMKELDRGCTILNGKGGYTNQDTHIVLVVISKYEKNILSKLIRSYDPNAFIIFNDGADVHGNFIKRLDS